ncbi:MAG: excinuclease ABC subunit UvrC [Lachnospiraceae bacterium]|nr:excinuclease ABC subunit UvrC [Lachnospiraceae bacterium]
MKFNIQEELKKLPARPGVYIMHNSKDEVIYVGKAIVLKNRVRQYFQSDRNKTPKIREMVSKIAWFEYIVVDSEREALVLECNLIKKYWPKYNTMLKDDKQYPYIRITTQEMYPTVSIARERKKDGARYFGPYTTGMDVRSTLDLIEKSYKIRRCRKVMKGEKVCDRPCLYHSMGQCPAPCQGNLSREEYNKEINAVISFLSGDYVHIAKQLEERMKAYAAELEFEKAAETRDVLNSIRKLDEKQKADQSDFNDRDFVAVAAKNDKAVACCFFMREGKLVGRENFYLSNVESEEKADILESFLKQFYSGTPHIPKEIYLSLEIQDSELIEGWLSELKGQKVSIKVPQKGDKLKLVQMAFSNAVMILEKDEQRLTDMEAKTTGALNEIKNLLNLPTLFRIESYDISNTQGFENVASMVVFENGTPKKSDYRKFKTRTIIGADDFGSMREVLTRRFEHYFRERDDESKKADSFQRLPDLLLIDGGRGQVNSVLEVLNGMKLNIPVCGMVKDDRHRTRGLWFNDEEVPIDTHSEGFHLVTRIQDETHRFAIEYHKSLRGKEQTHSILDDIPGIGKKRRIELMRNYSSLKEIKDADVEELASIEGMNIKAAEAVKAFLNKKTEPEGE